MRVNAGKTFFSQRAVIEKEATPKETRPLNEFVHSMLHMTHFFSYEKVTIGIGGWEFVPSEGIVEQQYH